MGRAGHEIKGGHAGSDESSANVNGITTKTWCLWTRPHFPP